MQVTLSKAKYFFGKGIVITIKTDTDLTGIDWRNCDACNLQEIIKYYYSKDEQLTFHAPMSNCLPTTY